MKGKIELKIDSFGFSTNIKNYNELVQIIEKLDGPIKNYATPSGLKRAWIVQDNYKEIIAEHQKKLNKPFWQFRNKAFDIVCTQEEFNELFGKEEKKKQMVEGGVYGIYVNGHLYYIGSTYDFEKRFKEHQAKLRADSKELYVYKLIQKGDVIEYKPLIKTKDVKVERQLERRDIEDMELALITLYYPIGNIAGRLQPNKYHET